MQPAPDVLDSREIEAVQANAAEYGSHEGGECLVLVGLGHLQGGWMNCLEHAKKQAILASVRNIANILAWLSLLMFPSRTMCVGKRIEGVVYSLPQ